MEMRNRTADRLRLLLSGLVSLAYLGGGIALIASSQSFERMDQSPLKDFLMTLTAGPLRYAMAALLLAYGAFRAYRAYQQYSDDEKRN
jgi:hypothetical protein